MNNKTILSLLLVLICSLCLAGCGFKEGGNAGGNAEHRPAGTETEGLSGAPGEGAEETRPADGSLQGQADEAGVRPEDGSVPQASDGQEVRKEDSSVAQAADASEIQTPDDSGNLPGQQDGSAGAAAPEEEEMPTSMTLNDKLAQMTLEDKLAQMMILTPDALAGTGGVTKAGDMTQQAFRELPAGGIIFMSPNLRDADQTKKMLANLMKYSRERTGLPLFTFVDEEGGSVRRISGSFSGIPEIGSMQELGKSGSAEKAKETGKTIGAYLHDLGFTCDFAPVADVLSNPQNQVVRTRSFGEDPEMVSLLSRTLADGLREEGVLPVFKHFPGHGSTAADTHEGYAYTEKTLEELRSCDLIPFADAVREGAEIIMISHISLPNVTHDGLPASLSHEIVTGLLREEMGFDGIVVTDALNMGAVSENYSSAEAAVLAVQAGADMLLMPADGRKSLDGLKAAVRDGRITEERIDESIRRILRVKGSMERLKD